MQQVHRKWHCDVSQWDMTQIIQNSQLILVGETLGQNFLFFGNVFRMFPPQKRKTNLAPSRSLSAPDRVYPPPHMSDRPRRFYFASSALNSDPF